MYARKKNSKELQLASHLSNAIVNNALLLICFFFFHIGDIE
jgi:hypothetical protein